MGKMLESPQTERAIHEAHMREQWNSFAPDAAPTPNNCIGSNDRIHGFFNFTVSIFQLLEMISLLPPVEAVSPTDSSGSIFTHSCFAKGHVPQAVLDSPRLSELRYFPSIRIELSRFMPRDETSMQVKWWFMLGDEAYEAWASVKKFAYTPAIEADFKSYMDGTVVPNSIRVKGVKWKGDGVSDLVRMPPANQSYQCSLRLVFAGESEVESILNRMADLEAADALASVEDYSKAKREQIIFDKDDEVNLSVEAYQRDNGTMAPGTYRQWRALNTVESLADRQLFRDHTRGYCMVNGLQCDPVKIRHLSDHDWAVHRLKTLDLEFDDNYRVDGLPYKYGSRWINAAAGEGV